MSRHNPLMLFRQMFSEIYHGLTPDEIYNTNFNLVIIELQIKVEQDLIRLNQSLLMRKEHERQYTNK
jgi:hypothetical protein